MNEGALAALATPDQLVVPLWGSLHMVLRMARKMALATFSQETL